MIDQERLDAVMKARMPGWEKLIEVERLSAGASRETYRIAAKIYGKDQQIALRRSQDDRSPLGGGPTLDAEAKLFELARKHGVPGPEVHFVLEPRDQLGTGFVMEWMEGETLGAKIARSKDFVGVRKSLARQCGEILAKLHKIDVEEEKLDNYLEAFTPEHAVRKTHASYLEFETPQPMIDFTMMWLLDNLPKKRKATLVHSDFRNGNFIVTPEEGIVAVLDWELAHIGDPMRDLGWLCTRSWRFGVNEKPVGGFGEYDELYAGYKSVKGMKVDSEAVKFWEVFGSFWWAVGCMTMGQSFRDGKNTSLERPVIGRRSSECQVDLVNMIVPDWARKIAKIPRTLSTTDMPSTDELITGVRDFLRDEVASKLPGRDGYLARVAANSLDIVLRELEFGLDAEAWERQALYGLLGKKEGSVGDMRATLCMKIRERSIDLKRPDLLAYLRDSVLAQVLIDQPSYPGAIECLNRG